MLGSIADPASNALQSIPLGGPFHQVGGDILQLPLTESGNRYIVVFLDYLTKWVKAFAIPNQSITTIPKILVEEILVIMEHPTACCQTVVQTSQ